MARSPSDSNVELHAFPGATHAYDSPYGPRTSALGYHFAYDEAATMKSWRLIDALLERGSEWPR